MCNKPGYLAITALCTLLASCNQAESLVQEAAQKRWDALIAGDLFSAYQYYTDAFQKTVPMEHFRRQVTGTGLWSRAEVEQVSCDRDREQCQADIRVTVAMKMRGLPKPVESSDVVHETWVKEGLFSDWRYMKN
ncbi:MAG: hypothetical protein KDI15_01330 [Thiothrix sp.]|nr:hypothetical protein [Thiothrix sp.]HPE61887.1 hypothetical protein [Thiolinea sp.]